MAAMSTAWTFSEFYTIILLYLLVCGQGGGMVDAANEGTDYMDLKQSYAKEIARVATQNQANCGTLDGCKTACTRAVCHPLSGKNSAQCTPVDNNEFCGGGDDPKVGCKYMMLDYTQSYVTLPPPGDITKIQPEVARDICLQTGLVPTFMQTSNSSEYSFVHYGSLSGAWRAYPARESDCTSPFDARKRPWFLDGISVRKEVKFIIDVGSTMATPVSPDYARPPEYTYLNLGQDIILEVLQTFSPQDFVEVISFDSLTATSLGAPVNIMPYDSFNYSGRPELGPLVAKVGSLATSPEVAPSNLDAAIAKAVSSFQPSTTLTGTYLKVVVVLTNGLFAPLNSTTVNFPSKALRDLRAKLMIYKLPPNQQDPFLLATPSLKDNLCSVDGSFELLVPQATLNPLYAMRSYFTHLARVHLIAVGDKPHWSNKYQSVSQLHNISTVTYPVFGNDSLLTGVAAIDVAIEDLPRNLSNLVLDDFPNRSNGIVSAPGDFPMTCDYQTANPVPICSNSKSSLIDVAVCKQTDFTSTLEQRTCCTSGEGSGTCVVPEEIESPGFEKWKIGLIGGLGGFALLAAIIAPTVVICQKIRSRKKRRNDFQFPGDEQALELGTRKS